jgi:uncharacterized protein (DUF427 family)
VSRQVLVPTPEHPITVEPASSRVTVRAGDSVIADSVAALVLREAGYPAIYYIPRVDVAPDVLEISEKTSYCPYKGDASYFSIVTADGELTDAVWRYLAPYAAVEQIAEHVAFYPDKVDITVG